MRKRLPSDIEEAIVAIIETILREHIGRENAIKGARILEMLRRYEPILSDRKMRQLIEDQLPSTCSCNKGYFIARDDKEARPVVKYLTSYIIALSKRRSAIITKYPDAGQMNFDFRGQP